MLKGFILGCFLCIPIISFAESNWKVVGSSKENVYGIDLCTRQISQNPYPIRVMPS